MPADNKSIAETGQSTTASTSRLISLGVITAVHGVRGQVKIRSFTADPKDISTYGPLRDKSGRQYNLTITGGTKDALIASVEGVSTREDAEKLRNTELFIPRAALPKTKNHEYYHEDLVGLTLVTESGATYGRIAAVYNFGAGDLIAVKRDSADEEMLPFTRKIFPHIDLQNGTATIVAPEIAPDE